MSERPDVVLMYGASDTGKSTQLGEAAKWEFARTGRISRLISADSGWDPMEDLIVTPDNPGGIIEAWSVQSLPDPWASWIELSEGSWPSAIEVSPGNWRLRLAKPKLSPGGKILATDGKSEVGQYLIEGISTLGLAGLQDHVRAQRKLGQDVVGSFTSTALEVDAAGKEATRTLSFAKAAPSHFGHVQDFLLQDLVPRFGSAKLPVARVIWTGHEARGKDDVTGIEGSVLGPATVGKAAVDRTSQKFGHTLHLTVETSFKANTQTKGQDVVREFKAWFVSHPDDVLTKMKWPAKVSLPLERSRELLKRFPGGYFPLTSQGIGVFLDFLAESAKAK